MIRTARVKSERGAFPAFGSTYLRRRQAASLFSRADQTFVIKIHSRIRCTAIILISFDNRARQLRLVFEPERQS
jgi:hypothetical protein